MKRFSLLYLAVCLVGSLSLSGCSANFAGPAVTSATTKLGTIHGAAYGGQQPIVGAEIFLFAVGTSAYGGPSTGLLTANANTTYETGTGNYYVTTDTNGEFNISGDYTCTPGTVLYLYSINGNPTYPSGTANAAASLMATLGTCPSGGTFAGQIPYVYMNEVSTVATAFAFQAYATNARAISIGPVGSGSGPSSLAQTGLQNAAANAAKLYNISGSIALFGANSTTPSGNGTVPNKLINAIANVLAGCINSGGSTTAACTQLFAYMPAAAGYKQPTETATAAIYLAKFPGTNVSNILGLEPINQVFSPAYTSTYALNDFTVGITYTDSSLSSPNDIAIDASGNAWVTNPGSGKVTQFAPSGAATSFSVPQANDLTIDTAGNVWVSSLASSPSVYELSNSGALVGHYTANTLVTPAGLTSNGSNIFLADPGQNDEFPYSANGSAPSGLTTAQNLTGVQNLAIDPNGYIWGTGSAGLVCQFRSQGGANAFAAGNQGAGCTSSGVIAAPGRVAIDSNSKAWIPNSSGNTIYAASVNSGGLVSTSYSGGGLSTPIGVAVDGNAAIWVANSSTADSISSFSTSSTTLGAALSPSTGFTSGLTGSIGHKNLAVDGSGDIWLANTSANSVTEVVGIAGAVVTPIAAGVSNLTIGNKP